MEYNFKKVHTGKDLAISFILIAAGIGLFFANKGLGICIAACGLLCLLFFKAGYKLNGQGALLQKSSQDLCKSCRTSILDFLKGQEVIPEIKAGCEGGSVRLDVWFSKARSIAFAQLYDFSNYEYKPLTDVVELEGAKAELLISKLS